MRQWRHTSTVQVNMAESTYKFAAVTDTVIVPKPKWVFKGLFAQKMRLFHSMYAISSNSGRGHRLLNITMAEVVTT